MSKDGIAPAAPALARRVAHSFLLNRPFDTVKDPEALEGKLTAGRIHYSMFDVRRSMFISFFFEQAGRSGGQPLGWSACGGIPLAQT